ncbi:MAG: sodium:calcium antiporter [Candidatus Bathyarchaeota archaeon]
MFEGMLVNVGVLVVALLLLDKFSHWTIVNSERIANITGFGLTAVGLLLVSASTTLPELSVAIFSTANEESVGVAIGNVLGSNIVNVCLIFGVCILYASWKNPACIEVIPFITREDVKSLQLGLFGASLIPLSLIYLGYASRLIGIVLILVFLWNSYQLSKNRGGLKDEGSLGEERKKLPKYVLMVFIGALGVIGCAYFIVDTATYIALSLGVPKVVIGSTIVAFGTSIPELATGLQATKKGNINMALGNIVGSCFINITFILGTTLVLSDLTVNIAAFTNLAVFSLIANLFLWYFLSGERISRREGAVLVFLYLMFLATSLRGYGV